MEMLRLEHLGATISPDSEGTLDGEGIAGCRERVIARFSLQHLQATLEVGRHHKRGGSVKATNSLWPLARGDKPVHGMVDNWNGTRVIVGQPLGSHEWRFRATLPRHSGDLLVVRGDHYTIEATASPCGLDGPGQHGFAAEQLDVLARYTLAATARRNHGVFFILPASPIATTTRSCWAALSVGYIGRLMVSA